MNNKIFVAIIVLVVVGFLGFAISRNNSSNTGELSNNFYGDGASETVLIEAYSLACPACTQAHEILKPIREKYQDQIKFQVMHFPLTASFGNKARIPHRAVEAAALQGQDKFWALHDHIFENRADWIDLPAEDLYAKMVEYATELGLNIAKFEEDYDSSQVNNKINNDIQHLTDLGATATPTFFLNGEKFEAKDFATQAIIEANLNKALGIEETSDTDDQAVPNEDSNPDTPAVEEHSDLEDSSQDTPDSNNDDNQ